MGLCDSVLGIGSLSATSFGDLLNAILSRISLGPSFGAFNALWISNQNVWLANLTMKHRNAVISYNDLYKGIGCDL